MVYKGKRCKRRDDVVNAALKWINNLVYGHDLTKNAGYCRPGTDTLKISALVENPNSHQATSKVYIKSLEGNFIDSLELNKTGLSDSSEIWTGNYLAPDSEDFYSISLSAKDNDESKTWTTNNISRFTTTGPVILDSISINKTFRNFFDAKPIIKNESNSITIKNASVNLLSDDPWITGISATLNLPDIKPVASSTPASNFLISYNDSLFPGYFNFKVEIMSDGWVYWNDSMRVTISPAVAVNEHVNHPLTFNLEQNYPNPFNPSTTIKYSIPKQSYVTLKVYDILGREVATLVNEEKPAGNYDIVFNGVETHSHASLPSGIYFYQIKASDYVSTKKMILLK